MKVHIYDVTHGFCALVEAPSGATALFDCGHNGVTGWRPSTGLAPYHSSITNLTVTNFDEDHVSDLPAVRQKLYVRSLSRNWSVSPESLVRAKAANGMGPGISAVVDMMRGYTGGPLNADWGGVQFSRFCHSTTDFSDENSLSLVTFVTYGGMKIVFPGDLTRAAWEAFLIDPNFRQQLAGTTIFVAAHHGRVDGYCPMVFNYCEPSVVVISDKNLMYTTQRVDYGRHARGVRWSDGTVRKTLTTRSDGKLTFTDNGGRFVVRTAA